MAQLRWQINAGLVKMREINMVETARLRTKMANANLQKSQDVEAKITMKAVGEKKTRRLRELFFRDYYKSKHLGISKQQTYHRSLRCCHSRSTTDIQIWHVSRKTTLKSMLDHGQRILFWAQSTNSDIKQSRFILFIQF